MSIQLQKVQPTISLKSPVFLPQPFQIHLLMKNTLLPYLLLFISCISCKDNVESNIEPILDACGIPQNYGFRDQYPIVSYPVANPNNPDEFAFLQDRFLSACCEQELMVFNIATKELRKVHQGNIANFDWGKQGWILWHDQFTSNLFKIKPSGDSLARIPVDSFPYNFALNLAGDKIIYSFNSPIDFSSQTAISDLNGENLQQQVNYLGYYVIWHLDSILTEVGTSDGISASIVLRDVNKLFEAPDQSVIANLTIPNIGYPSCAYWADERTMVISTEKGTYTVDFPTLSSPTPPVQIWAATCPSVGSTRFTIHRAAKKIITQRFEIEKTSENTPLRTSSFVRMNLDGTGEEVIEIPGF
jgi:hypothetical protein